jgi:hypothetical protein
VCGGGIDEDQDGFTDCADTDCVEDSSCPLGCVPGAEWGSLACRFVGLTGQVDSRLEPRRVRAVLAAKLQRAARTRAQAEESCAAGQERRARVALRTATRALAGFRRRLDSPAGRHAIAPGDRDAWRALAAQMHLDLDALRAGLDCRA